MKNALAKILSTSWWSSELALLVWMLSWLRDMGAVGAVQNFLFHTFVLWISFTVLMSLKRRAEKNGWPRWAVKALRAAYVPAYGYDCWYNTRFGTLLFLEFPPARVLHVRGIKIKHRFEPLTRRLQRHYPRAGWRGNIARVFCWLAHKIDRGHCL